MCAYKHGETDTGVVGGRTALYSNPYPLSRAKRSIPKS